MIKVGIIADKDASPSYKTQDVFIKLYTAFGPTLQVFSTGSSAVEQQFKKLALEKNCHYGEFNLASTAQNVFSMMSRDYYSRNYHPTHEPDAQLRLFRHVERMIVFNAGNLKPEKFLKMGEKTKTKTVIINL